MAGKNIRGSRMGSIAEDAFGTPPAARGSMNNLANGADDDDLEPGEELLTDEGDGMDVMDKPIYPEGRTIRIRLGDLRRLIERSMLRTSPRR